MSNEAFNGGPEKWHRYRFLFPLVFIAAALALGYVVMFLWNAILPEILGAKVLNFWQALGLLVLCRILFGGFGGGRRGGGPPFGRRGEAHWMNMNEEERARFRADWEARCRKRGE